MGRAARAVVAGLCLSLCLCMVLPSVASAKDHGLNTPSGRRIYGPNERLSELYEQDSRQFVIEVVMGASAEGNLGVNLGWLAPQLGGLEFYAGSGLQTNPSHQWTLSSRYWFDILGLRPFVSMGYGLQFLDKLGTNNSSLFWELGYKWRVHHTYHFTLGLGVRYIVDVTVEPDSPLRGGDVDQVALERELDALNTLVPTVALRFSRAF